MNGRLRGLIDDAWAPFRRELETLEMEALNAEAERRERALDLIEGGWPVTWVAQACGLSRPTLYRELRARRNGA